jgi:hypothetical protein
MDPAMVVANTIHNSSMILLHQRIAYPSPDLSAYQLPSYHSAQTCQAAAKENAVIITRFLATAPEDMAVSPYIGLSAYLGAKAFLSMSLYLTLR